MSDMHERLQNLIFPFIIPVDDAFKYKIHKKTKRTFAVVSNQIYKDVNDVILWLEKETKENWLIPTITIAGEEWRMNPKYSDDGWTWLFVKG